MSAAFDKLDTNHDGVVSRAEFNQGAAAQQGGVQYMTTYGEPVASAGGPTVTYAGASGMAYATAPGVTYAAAQQGVQYATTYGEPVGSAGVQTVTYAGASGMAYAAGGMTYAAAPSPVPTYGSSATRGGPTEVREIVREVPRIMVETVERIVEVPQTQIQERV
eukprot:CAMPEP_0179293774 /NCGR_PEP_ID=MMETSP0797-20121207/43549_1 /TAXON_ID=47934 /ORGANISM="Dinophysis acuminata, Strain DAEP01" /LENGTH=162 /DNA_ID=CAMNT_0021002937 /DNA_START=1 /DNA_END=486 /DNA_ORIENTATION=+